MARITPSGAGSLKGKLIKIKSNLQEAKSGCDDAYHAAVQANAKNTAEYLKALSSSLDQRVKYLNKVMTILSQIQNHKE